MSETMTERHRLPFALFEQGLTGLQAAIHAGSDLLLAALGTAGPAGVARREAGRPAEADDAGDEPTETPREAVLEADTAASTAALATALNDEAVAALSAAAGPEKSVTDGLEVRDEQPELRPDEELGPKPYTPQVGP